MNFIRDLLHKPPVCLLCAVFLDEGSKLVGLIKLQPSFRPQLTTKTEEVHSKHFFLLSEDSDRFILSFFLSFHKTAFNRKMLENHDLPLTGNFVSKFWLLLFDYRPWEVFWHKKKFFGKVTNLRILLSKILLLGRVFNKNCCLWEKASFYLCFEKKSCWGSCLCSSSFHGALLFSFHPRLFLISAAPNISDTISSSLTKCGGWGKKWLQLLKCESASQTRSGFRKGPVPVSFHLGILILDSM